MPGDPIDIRLVDPARDSTAILAGLSGDLDAGELNELIARTASLSPPTIYVGAWSSDGVVGLVAFMAHMLETGHEKVLAYQAAGVLTSSARRGQGIFPAIVREAESLLRRQGGKFIFGFPNANAFPVWTKKLGYSSIPTQTWRAPAAFGLHRLFLRASGTGANASVIHQNDRDMIELKRRLYPDNLFVAEEGPSLIWGVLRTKKAFGFNAPALDIGGLRFSNETDLKGLFSKVLNLAQRPSFVRFTTVSNNPQNAYFRDMITPRESHHCLIFRELDGHSLEDLGFCFYGGVTDTF
jgi:hypothetical protein